MQRAPAPVTSDALAADITRYAGFGAKNAGGSGDTSAGEWIEAELARSGFDLARQSVRAAWIDEHDPVLQIGASRLAVAAHTLGEARRFGSVEAPLRVWGASVPRVEANGAVVVAHLQAQRWSSAEQLPIRRTIERAFEQRAAALVLVTNGPTRELIKLNRTLTNVQPGPVALMAPREWGRLPDDAEMPDRATLTLNAQEAGRDAFNIIGRIDRGAPTTVVVSTPRSGWTTCAGERGPGIATFLTLARGGRNMFRGHNLLFICTSAHEFENAGNAAIIAQLAPRPERTALWLHLGAGFAARDWHEAGGEMAPLPSADPQRFLIASPQLLEAAREIFAGVPGLEAPRSSEQGAAGELSNIIAAGYPTVIGLLGAHRFHHVADDDMRCIEPTHVVEVAQRVAALAARATSGVN